MKVIFGKLAKFCLVLLVVIVFFMGCDKNNLMGPAGDIQDDHIVVIDVKDNYTQENVE